MDDYRRIRVSFGAPHILSTLLLSLPTKCRSEAEGHGRSILTFNSHADALEALNWINTSKYQADAVWLDPLENRIPRQLSSQPFGPSQFAISPSCGVLVQETSNPRVVQLSIKDASDPNRCEYLSEIDLGEIGLSNPTSSFFKSMLSEVFIGNQHRYTIVSCGRGQNKADLRNQFVAGMNLLRSNPTVFDRLHDCLPHGDEHRALVIQVSSPWKPLCFGFLCFKREFTFEMGRQRESSNVERLSHEISDLKRIVIDLAAQISRIAERVDEFGNSGGRPGRTERRLSFGSVQELFAPEEKSNNASFRHTKSSSAEPPDEELMMMQALLAKLEDDSTRSRGKGEPDPLQSFLKILVTATEHALNNPSPQRVKFLRNCWFFAWSHRNTTETLPQEVFMKTFEVMVQLFMSKVRTPKVEQQDLEDVAMVIYYAVVCCREERISTQVGEAIMRLVSDISCESRAARILVSAVLESNCGRNERLVATAFKILLSGEQLDALACRAMTSAVRNTDINRKIISVVLPEIERRSNAGCEAEHAGLLLALREVLEVGRV